MAVGSGARWRMLSLQAGLIASAIGVGSNEAAAQDQLKVAAVFETPIEEPWVDYPEVAFAFGSGIGPAEPNFAVFDNWIHEPAYLAGMIAGKLTSSTNPVSVCSNNTIPDSRGRCTFFREISKVLASVIAGICL